MALARVSALALGLVALLVASVQAAGARSLLQNPKNTLAGRAVVLAINYVGDGAQPESLMFLRTESDGDVDIELEDPTDMQDIATGMNVVFNGEWQPDKTKGGRRRFKGSSIRGPKGKPDWAGPKDKERTRAGSASAAPKKKKKGVVQAAAIDLDFNPVVFSNLNTVIIPISPQTASGATCPGLSPQPMTVSAIKNTVFAELNPTARTVGSGFADCSYNKAMLTMNNSRVVSPVRLPCNGTTNGVNWSFNTCTREDFYAWADAADALMPSKSVSLSQYRYRVYLLPPGRCLFGGVGTVGCDGDPGFECRVWIAGGLWGRPDVYMHELGHNLYLKHAGSIDATTGVVDDYGDATGAMGLANSNRCFNTPHAWQLGWISTQLLDASSLAPGQTVVASLASQGATARSGVRIDPTWAPGTNPVYLGYRTPINGDVDMDMGGTPGRVHIYTSAITDSYTLEMTYIRGTLAVANTAWTHPTAGLVVRLRGFPIIGGVPRTVATVTICRPNGPETPATCAAGTDNDCNGLAGTKDPACAALPVRL